MRHLRLFATMCGFAVLAASCGREQAAEVALVSPPNDDVRLTAEAVGFASIETTTLRSALVAQSLKLTGSLAGNPWTATERDVISAADAADARLRLAESKSARLVSLLAQGIVSQQDVDVARSELEQSRAAAADQHAQRANLGLTGEALVTGPVKIWGLATLPEAHLGEVRRGSAVEVLTDAFPGRSFAGHVVDISGASDPQTRGFTIRVAVDDPGLELRSQMLARFAITLPPRAGLALPSSAVLLEADGAYVYIARSATTFHRQAVRVEAVAPDRVLVLAGVADGEIVVTQGAQILEAERLKVSFTPVEKD